MKFILLFLLFVNFSFAEINHIKFKLKENDNILLNNILLDNITTLNDFSTASLNEKLNINPLPFYKFYKRNIYTEENIKHISEKLKDYLNSIGYYNHKFIKIEDDNTIYFVIEKNERIKISSIKIEDKYREFLTLKEDDFFTNEAFTNSKNKIKRYFNKNGLLNAILDAKAFIDLENYEVTIEMKIIEKEKVYINKINIDNQTNISNELLLKQIVFKEGEAFDIEKTEKTFNNIYSYGVLDKIIIEPKIIENDINKKDVFVSVSEDKNKFFKGIFGYNDDELFNLGLYWGDNNFFSNLKEIEIGSKISEKNKSIYNNFKYPYINFPIFGEMDIVNKVEYELNNYENYEQKSINNKFYFVKKLELENHLGLLTELSDIQNNFNDEELYNESDIYFINSIFYKGIIDKRDNKINPRNGFFYSFYVENSNLNYGSEIEYYKLLSDFRIMKTFGNYSFYYKNKTGVISNEVPLFKKFYTGGSFTNRGYNYLTVGDTQEGKYIGGISINENNFEISYKVNEDFDLAIFYDSSLLSNTKYDFGNDYYNSYGAGVRYNTKIGPIRFDLAIPNKVEEKYKMNFSIGLSF